MHLFLLSHLNSLICYLIGYAKLKGSGGLIGVIVCINKIKLNSGVYSSIRLDELRFAELHGTVIILKEGIINFVEWSGEYGDLVKLAGNYSIQISSHVSNDGIMYFLEKNISETIALLREYVNNDREFFLKSTAIQNPYGSTQ